MSEVIHLVEDVSPEVASDIMETRRTQKKRDEVADKLEKIIPLLGSIV